jgi:hypothetical protein
MGHSSVQVTVDVHGHLVPSANIACADRLDTETSLHQSAPGTHQAREALEQQSPQVLEKIWLPPRDSNPDMLIQSPQGYGSRCFQLWYWLSCKFLSFVGLTSASSTEIASAEQSA